MRKSTCGANGRRERPAGGECLAPILDDSPDSVEWQELARSAAPKIRCLGVSVSCRALRLHAQTL
jgi:hypothetical protein